MAVAVCMKGVHWDCREVLAIQKRKATGVIPQYSVIADDRHTPGIPVLCLLSPSV